MWTARRSDFLAAEKAAIRTLSAEFGFGECTDEAIARVFQNCRPQTPGKSWKTASRQSRKSWSADSGEFFETEGLDVTAAPAFNERYQVCLGDLATVCSG